MEYNTVTDTEQIAKNDGYQRVTRTSTTLKKMFRTVGNSTKAFNGKKV